MLSLRSIHFLKQPLWCTCRHGSVIRRPALRALPSSSAAACWSRGASSSALQAGSGAPASGAAAAAALSSSQPGWGSGAPAASASEGAGASASGPSAAGSAGVSRLGWAGAGVVAPAASAALAAAAAALAGAGASAAQGFRGSMASRQIAQASGGSRLRYFFAMRNSSRRYPAAASSAPGSSSCGEGWGGQQRSHVRWLALRPKASHHVARARLHGEPAPPTTCVHAPRLAPTWSSCRFARLTSVWATLSASPTAPNTSSTCA